MNSIAPSVGRQVAIPKSALNDLIHALKTAHYTVVGPTVKDGAIVYEEINQAHELPVGWRDEQDAGKYRLIRRHDGRYFGFVVGPHSWKKYLYPPRLKLFSAKRGQNPLDIKAADGAEEKYALLGVRGCELAALGILDRVVLHGSYRDPVYTQRRTDSVIIAVNCTEPGGTCFCVSMGTGPKCQSGYDLCLTELEDVFLVDVGTARGAELVAATGWMEPAAEYCVAAEHALQAAQLKMGRKLDTTGLPALLCGQLDHPRWEDVAQRCLSCGNCTMVCPTCFCTDILDVSDLNASTTERIRVWDSCFSMRFSYVHGGVHRASVRSRYRQWLTHKLATWTEQFGTMGCVGCGRCITWCPVGIDLTEEAAAIRATAK